jgi:hypothetical protein
LESVVGVFERSVGRLNRQQKEGDPAALSQREKSLAIRNNLEINQSVSGAISFLQTQSGVYSQVNQTLDSFGDLVSRVQKGEVPDGGKKELLQIQARLRDLAESTFNGSPLFSESSSDVVDVDLSPDGGRSGQITLPVLLSGRIAGVIGIDKVIPESDYNPFLEGAKNELRLLQTRNESEKAALYAALQILREKQTLRELGDDIETTPGGISASMETLRSQMAEQPITFLRSQANASYQSVSRMLSG